MKALLLVPLLLTLPSCTSLSLRGELVRITTHATDAEGCKLLGDVRADPPYGTSKTAENKLRNQAAELGADVVVRASYGIGSVDGKAYDCGGRYSGR